MRMFALIFRNTHSFMELPRPNPLLPLRIITALLKKGSTDRWSQRKGMLYHTEVRSTEPRNTSKTLSAVSPEYTVTESHAAKRVLKDIFCCHTKRRIGRAPPFLLVVWHRLYNIICQGCGLHNSHCHTKRTIGGAPPPPQSFWYDKDPLHVFAEHSSVAILL